MAEVVGRDNGKLVKVESWGRRKLAYPVGKQKKGVYIYVKYVGRGGVQELERNLKLQDSVPKFPRPSSRTDDVDVSSVVVDAAEGQVRAPRAPGGRGEESQKALGPWTSAARAQKSERSDDEFGDDDVDGAADVAEPAAEKGEGGLIVQADPHPTPED